jgi:hypothetical protein
MAVAEVGLNPIVILGDVLRAQLVALVLVACGSAPTPSSQPVELGSGDPTARGETEGVVVELWLDRTQVAIDDVVLAMVRVSNQGTQALGREGNTCGTGPARTTVEQRDNAGALEFGERWPGRADVFKRSLLNDAGLGAQRDLGTFIDTTMFERNVLCTLESRMAPFAPGATAQAALAWRASARDGSIVVPGATVIKSTFQTEEWMANPAPVIRVTAEAEIEIIGADPSAEFVGPTLVDYVDAALAVDDFREWINGMPAGTRLDPNYIFWPTAEGNWPGVAPYTSMVPRPVVEIGAFRLNDGGDGEEFRAVVIDRATGQVLALRTQ